MTENTDDLERTLMLAAAAADSCQYEDEAKNTEESENENTETHFYVENNSRNKATYHSDSSEVAPSKRLRTSSESESHNAELTHRGVKRKHEDTDEHPRKRTSEGYSQVVATHYNLLEDKGLDARSKSPIIYLRNFQNWTKSMLLNEYLTKVKETKKQHNAPLRVLDMGCGKGGDLLKWKIGAITHLICTDIASVSLDQCKARYNNMKARAANKRGGGSIYSIEYILADCSRIRLREKYSDPSIKLDIVSCQFALHYSFESLSQAECMLRNAGECLQPGGFFIGTIPDANEVIARARRNRNNAFGNTIYNVKLDFDVNRPPPLFGAKYHFHLEGVVDCPEFLVHFPTLVKLAKKYGLKLVRKEKFSEFFERMKDEGRQLLTLTESLETYPPQEDGALVGSFDDDYDHAKRFLKTVTKDNVKIGTLSKSDWEASSFYATFAFQKVKNTWNADGTPCYNI